MRSRFVFLSLFSFLMIPMTGVKAQISLGSYYTGCSAPPAYVGKHNMTSSSFQSNFNYYTSRGYRLTDISGYKYGSKTRFAALFEKKSGPAYVAKHNMSSSSYQYYFNYYTSRGYRPTDISGYKSGSNIRYAAIFEKKTGAPYVAKHNMTESSYQSNFNYYTSRGYRLTFVDAFGHGTSARYAAIFEKKTGPAYIAKHNMSTSTYQFYFNAYANAGYRLKQVAGYSKSGSPRLAAIWEKTTGPARYAHHNMTSKSYQAAFTNKRYRGYKLVGISGYNSGSSPRFAAVFDSFGAKESTASYIDAKIQAHRAKYGAPGISIAITKNECLVYAQGYGNAGSSEPAHALHSYRVASVSKPITAIAIMNLVEEGKLSLNSRVFGSNSILGTMYGTPGNFGMRYITVRHLLEHSSGWSNDGDDPMFNGHSSHAAVIKHMLEERNLKAWPGVRYEYLNFGYTVLGRIVEKITGKTYESYVKSAILAPSGITAMRIGASTESGAAPNEVTYYPSSAYNLRPYHMDAHGGWIASAVDLAKLMVRVDKGFRKYDILYPGTIDSMLDPTGPNSGYAKGFISNSTGSGHNGEMRGTGAFWWKTSDGFTWAILMNKRPDGDGGSFKAKDMMNDITDDISSWPSYDLFK